jgi:molecular chaperone GrpE
VSECSRDTHAGSPFLRRLRWPRGTADRGAGEGQEKVLAPLVERLEAIERRLEEVARLKPPEDMAADGVQQALAALEKQISRAGREQFKAQALAEAQMEQLSAALEMLRAADARREADVAASSARSRDEQAAARLDVVQAMLPALDGLDEALRSGRRLLEQHTERQEPPRPATLLGRLRRHVLRRGPGAAPDPRVDALREAMAAWLVGLTFVRQRLLDVLADEGVQPIAAQGALFDPHYHVAVEVVPSDETMPPGTVASELRRGYMVGERVLRYAEVAVAAQTEMEQDTSRAS